MTGLEKITEKIMQEAKSDAENILAEARERAKQISDSYLKKSEEAAETIWTPLFRCHRRNTRFPCPVRLELTNTGSVLQRK